MWCCLKKTLLNTLHEDVSYCKLTSFQCFTCNFADSHRPNAWWSVLQAKIAIFCLRWMLLQDLAIRAAHIQAATLTEKAAVNHPQSAVGSEAADIHGHWIELSFGQVIKAYMHNLRSVAVWEKQVLFSERTQLGSLLPLRCEGPEPGREIQTGHLEINVWPKKQQQM